jgi:hypothetical protein
MGFDLISCNNNNKGVDRARFTGHGWYMLLDLAKSNGWIPAGTIQLPVRPCYETRGSRDRWGGGYCSNEAQIVTAEDAAALANALEQALDDIPDVDVMGNKRVPLASLYPEVAANPLAKEIIVLVPDAESNTFEYFSEESKKELIAFTELC